MQECPFPGGRYDLMLGTSEHGEQTLAHALNLPSFKHLLVVLGGPDGLEAALQVGP